MKIYSLSTILLLVLSGCSSPKGAPTIEDLVSNYIDSQNTQDWQKFISTQHPKTRDLISKNDRIKKSILKKREHFTDLTFVYGVMSKRGIKKWKSYWDSPVIPTHEVKLKYKTQKNGGSGSNAFAHKSSSGWFIVSPLTPNKTKAIIASNENQFEYYYEELEEHQHNWELLFSVNHKKNNFSLKLEGPENDSFFENYQLNTTSSGMKKLRIGIDGKLPDLVNGNQFHVHLFYGTPSKAVGEPIVLKGKEFVQFIPNTKPDFVAGNMKIAEFSTYSKSEDKKCYQLILSQEAE